jgi:TonB family protein
MGAAVQPLERVEDELRLFPDWKRSEVDVARGRMAAFASVALHAVCILALSWSPVGTVPQRDATRILAQMRNPAKLVAPPAELTQKASNRGKVGKEFQLEDLLPRPRLQQPPSPTSSTRPASPVPIPPALAFSEPPKLEPAPGIAEVPALARGTTPLPPPEIQAEEKPKLAFESPGTPSGGAGKREGFAALKPPSGSVAEVGRELARGAIPGGIIVGDVGAGAGGLGEMLNVPPAPGRIASTLELLSDPQGVDFRPYLITILSSVRRNWYAVMPESAKLGRRGRTVIQFAISRDGSVPKLVITLPSGTEALDRAAVAGVSASNPFPPLPSEFRGAQVRLQFVFLYNIKN